MNIIKTIYEFEIYSYKGIETVKVETSYKPLWQIENEIEKNYKLKNNIKSSVIVCLVDKKNIILL